MQTNEKKILNGQKIGLCLSGGGARGPYQIGALTAMKELGIFSKFQAFSGTSIGSANMAVVVSRSIDKAKEVWDNLPEETFPKNKTDKREEEVRRRLIDMDRGIYTMDTFEEVMLKAVDYDCLRKHETYVTVSPGGKKDEGIFELVKASYKHYIGKDSKAIYLPLKELNNEQIHKAIVASCSIPVLFAPVEYEERKYYDGGVFDRVPIKPLVDAGCDEIVVVHLHRQRFYRPEKQWSSVKFHEIKHKGYLGGILDFSRKHAVKLYEWGYEDARKYFENLLEENSNEE